MRASVRLAALACSTRCSTTPEAAISFGHEHLLLRPVPGHQGIVLHLVLQTSAANLTLARMQLERVPVPQ